MERACRHSARGRVSVSERVCLFLLGALLATWPLMAAQRVAIERGHGTRYLANADDPGIQMAWTVPGFDDAAWTDGVFGLGYDEAGNAVGLLDTAVPAGTVSLYTRTEFEVFAADTVSNVLLGADYDDGFVAWINGVEVYRSPEMPAGPVFWDSRPGPHESTNGAVPDYSPVVDVTAAARPALVAGTNVLAVGVWNQGPGSSDLVLVPQLLFNEELVVTRGPYLQMGTDNEITVRWRTNFTSDSRVAFGSSPDELIQEKVGSTSTTEHSVTLSGLRADTTYYYAVGSTAAQLAGADAEHYFLTAPSRGMPKPTRVWVLGDAGTGTQNAEGVRDAYHAFAGERHTDLWLMLGDNAYPNGTDDEYQRKMFEVFHRMLRKSVLWPTLGNHDAASARSVTQTGVYYDIFDLPTEGEVGGMASGTEAYYSFDYANIHFVVLNSQDLNRGATAPMMTWLDADLADTRQDWIVAYWHHPPYSKGSHDSDTESRLVEMRENAVPILEDHGVDLVLTGHSHSYERSFLIDGHYGDSTTFDESMKVNPGDGNESGFGPYTKTTIGPVPHEGAVYAVAGSSGQVSPAALDHPAMLVNFNALGSMVLDVVGNRLDARFIDLDGNELDHFTIIKGSTGVVPVAEFAASPDGGQVPLEVRFLDLSEQVPTEWEWDFDNDGFVDSRLRNPTIEFDRPGLRSVRLTVRNTAGADDELKLGLLCITPDEPGRVRGLQLGDENERLFWEPFAEGSRYDVVRGDLMDLRATAGDFRTAQSGCIEDDGADSEAIDPDDPAPGGGFFYLVRNLDCEQAAGSYDTDSPFQLMPRDLLLGGSAAVCGCDPSDDPDADRYCNSFDNCDGVASDDLTDTDADGIGDVCDACVLDAANDIDGDGHCAGVDNCPATANADQLDLDGDGQGNVCDPCPLDAADDLDGDGVCANLDNCPTVGNDQTDQDGDGLGDACDPCAADPNNDFDGDGFCADVDNCPFTANVDQSDADLDQLGDPCDPCPLDPGNDADGDFLCAGIDNCPNAANFGQEDFDGDGQGDACDADDDDDGFVDDEDCAPRTPWLATRPAAVGNSLRVVDGDTTQLTWGRSFQDYTWNVYRGVRPTSLGWTYALECIRTETSVRQTSDDASPGPGTLIYYVVSARNACGESSAASPSDGTEVFPESLCPPGNLDSDADGRRDLEDNCPLDPNPDLADGDLDFVGDVCDNCPGEFNPDQLDSDGDGTGNACQAP